MLFSARGQFRLVRLSEKYMKMCQNYGIMQIDQKFLVDLTSVFMIEKSCIDESFTILPTENNSKISN